jgi:hypothetical protein
MPQEQIKKWTIDAEMRRSLRAELVQKASLSGDDADEIVDLASHCAERAVNLALSMADLSSTATSGLITAELAAYLTVCGMEVVRGAALAVAERNGIEVPVATNWEQLTQ